MASAQEMAGYAAHLNANTPASSKGKPVTEIAYFKLNPAFAADHAAVLAEFESQIVPHTRPGTPHAKGIRRIAWGFAVDDPASFVWCLDWDKIEDHWDFWLTEAFTPVVGAISKLFEPGRPLVRHYDFGREGMLGGEESKVVKFMIWDDSEGEMKGKSAVQGSGKVVAAREAHAVDLSEDTWWCSMLGFESEEDAAAAEVKADIRGEVVSKVCRLKYA